MFVADDRAAERQKQQQPPNFRPIPRAAAAFKGTCLLKSVGGLGPPCAVPAVPSFGVPAVWLMRSFAAAQPPVVDDGKKGEEPTREHEAGHPTSFGRCLLSNSCLSRTRGGNAHTHGCLRSAASEGRGLRPRANPPRNYSRSRSSGRRRVRRETTSPTPLSEGGRQAEGLILSAVHPFIYFGCRLWLWPGGLLDYSDLNVRLET